MQDWQAGMLGRPRKPKSDDPRIERRRETYRISKQRTYERTKHERGKCSTATLGYCPLQIEPKTGGRPRKPEPEPPPKRVTVTLNDGRRVWYERP